MLQGEGNCCSGPTSPCSSCCSRRDPARKRPECLEGHVCATLSKRNALSEGEG